MPSLDYLETGGSASTCLPYITQVRGDLCLEKLKLPTSYSDDLVRGAAQAFSTRAWPVSAVWSTVRSTMDSSSARSPSETS